MKTGFLSVGALAAGLVLCQYPAYSDQITAASKITSVTVYPRGAQVSRDFEVSLKSGKQAIVLNNLPTVMLGSSVQINPGENSGIRIDSIDIKYIKQSQKDLEEKADYKQVKEKLADLKRKQQELQLNIKTAETQKLLIAKLIDMPTSKAAEPSQNWSDLYNLVTEKTKEANSIIFNTQGEIDELQKQIAAVTKELAELVKSYKDSYQITAYLMAEKDIKTTLNLRYHVQGASWRQEYETHLDTKNGIDDAKLKIIRRASIQQKTGEDWNNVSVTLSTTNPTAGNSQPEVKPLRLVLRPDNEGGGKIRQEYDQRQRFYKSKTRTSNQYQLSNVNLYNNAPSRPGADMEKHLAFHSLVKLPETVTLTGKGDAKQIPMGVLDLKTTVRAIAVPRQKPVAFLAAKFTMPESMNSPHGKAVIYRDGAYIGTGELPNLNSGSEYYLSFGADTKVQLKRVEVDRSKEKQSGILSSTQSDERHFKMTVKNLHAWKMPVIVLDRYPYSDDKEVNITLFPTTTPPTRKNVDDQRGILAWDKTIPAKGEAIINLDYKVTWPAKHSIDIAGPIPPKNLDENFQNFRFGAAAKF